MNDKINITKSDGVPVSADLICFIENTVTGKRYVYYTLNEVVNTNESNSTVKIYVAKVQQNNPQLDTLITEEDWGKLKGYMSDALKDISNPEIKYIPISELDSPISVSEKAIAMPTSYDYVNKQRGIYAEAIADTDSAASGESAPQVMPTDDATVQTEVQPEPVAPDTLVATTTVEPTEVVNEPISIAQESESVSQPIVENPPVTSEPLVEPTPALSPFGTPEPAVPEPPMTPVMETPTEVSSLDGGQAVLEPINIPEIEAKYEEMIATINKLKEQEIEAAKRYNATIELSEMHKEQHASFVQEQVMSEPMPAQPELIPFGTPSVEPAPEPAPLDNVAPQTVEPTPVTPVVPEPAPVTPQDLETNWFDMPSNQ